MVKFSNTTEEIVYINALAVDNNFAGSVSSLRRLGFSVPDTISRDELLKKLWLLFKTNKALWVDWLKGVSYNQNANNYTTSDEVMSMMYTAETINGAKFNLGSFFGDIANFIAGSSTATTTTTEEKGNTVIGAISVVTIVAVAITIIVMLFRK